MNRVLGRYGVGSSLTATLLRRNGIRHTVRWADGEVQDILCLGGAASSAFVGSRQAAIKRRCAEFEAEENVHTSIASPRTQADFVRALAPHATWTDDDWFVNIQLDGTSAVHAAVEVLAARRPSRPHVAVFADSYHGPATMTFGRGSGMRRQLTIAEDPHSTQRSLALLQEFLAAHGAAVSVIVVEPQSGSSRWGRPRSPSFLRTLCSAARERGIAVCFDEVMCGLGRHGEGTCFRARAVGAKPDAVVFGKAIGAARHQLAGALFTAGRRSASMPIVQRHTYAGASPAAFAAAAATLDALRDGAVHGGIRERAALVQARLGQRYGLSGQGMLWGAPNAPSAASCRRRGVWPYFVGDGMLITPPLDVCTSQLGEALDRLADAGDDDRRDCAGNC